MASSRRHGQRHHYDSVSSDTEYSEPEEHRKGCIKRSKYVLCCIRKVSVGCYDNVIICLLSLVVLLFYCLKGH